MQFRYTHLISWMAGFLGIFIVVWVFIPAEFFDAVRSVGIMGAIIWLVLTLVSRMLLIETTVRPVEVLGFSMPRADAFWIGWVRSFSNQLLPMSGVALYAHQIRRKVGISWSELAALSAPQFLLAALAIGILGMVATFSNAAAVGLAAIPLTFVYAAMSSGAVLAATKADWLIEALPARVTSRAGRLAASFVKLAQHPQLTMKLVGFHLAAILTRGGRIWLLFAATGNQLGWQEALFIVALAESAVLVQLTPAGLGVREGAIVGAAALMNVPPDISASVAVIDRLLDLVTTTVFAGPAFVMLYRVGGSCSGQNDS